MREGIAIETTPVRPSEKSNANRRSTHRGLACSHWQGRAQQACSSSTLHSLYLKHSQFLPLDIAVRAVKLWGQAVGAGLGQARWTLCIDQHYLGFGIELAEGTHRLMLHWSPYSPGFWNFVSCGAYASSVRFCLNKEENILAKFWGRDLCVQEGRTPRSLIWAESMGQPAWSHTWWIKNRKAWTHSGLPKGN